MVCADFKNWAIFIISSQKRTERKEADVKDRDEAIALAIAGERSSTDASLQPLLFLTK
jgi:hypothetical protein